MATLSSTPGLNQLEPTAALIGAPPAEVINEITSGLLRVSRRIEIYESDGVTPFDIPNWNARLVEGTVTVDRDRDERRNLDCLLENNDKALKNDPYNGFWYDKILKAFWGIRYYDTTTAMWKRWETPVGEFMIDRLDEDRFPNAVKVTGRDYTKKCLVAKLAYSLTFQTGTRVEEIIRALAANAGVTKFALPITNQTYNKDLVFTRGTERWKVMKDIADSAGYEIYFQADGSLTMREYPDPTTNPLAWSFTQNYGGSLVDYKRSSNDSRVYNHIIVTGATEGSGGVSTPESSVFDDGSNTNSVIVFAEAKNEDASSPTRIARLGDRVLPFDSDLFTTNEQAQEYANTQLRIASLEEYTMDFEALIIPWLDGSDIVEIVEEDRAEDFTPSRFLLSNFTIPLGLGSMTGTGRRVTIVGTRQTTEFS